MDLDYTLRIDWLLLSITKNQLKKASYDKWEVLHDVYNEKHTILITIRGSMPDKISAKSFPAEVADPVY